MKKFNSSMAFYEDIILWASPGVAGSFSFINMFGTRKTLAHWGDDWKCFEAKTFMVIVKESEIWRKRNGQI